MDQDDTLTGLRVLDLAQGIAGSYAARLFADAGADVIKIEQPGGDPIRRQGPFPADRPDLETGALWLYLNTNKRGITLDIGQPAGRRLFELLLEKAHVIMESFVPGYLDSLGLGFAHLTKIKRRIVLVSVTPYGQWGPCSGWKSTNLTSLAASGHLSPAGEPPKDSDHQAEYLAGLHAFAAGATAAFAADATEVPQHVDISIMECLASVLDMDPALWPHFSQDESIPQSPGLLETVHPRAGRLTYPGPPLRASGLPWRAGRASLLGEHNEDVYCGELALSREDLAQLRAQGVV